MLANWLSESPHDNLFGKTIYKEETSLRRPQSRISASFVLKGQLFFIRFEKIFSLKLSENFSFIRIFGLKLFRSQVIWRLA